jgi:hypothetical protein
VQLLPAKSYPDSTTSSWLLFWHGAESAVLAGALAFAGMTGAAFRLDIGDTHFLGRGPPQ